MSGVLLAMLRADLYRALRTPALLLAPIVVAAMSTYGALSLFAGASGAAMPSLLLLSPGTVAPSFDGIPSITESVGMSGLSGGFLPLVDSLTVVLFLAQGLQSGHYGGVVGAGVSRATLVLEALVISLVTSSVLLAVCFVPYLVGYPLMGASLLSEPDLDALPAWLALAVLHVFLYSFAAGCVTLVTRRRMAGVAASLVVSTGLAEIVLVTVLRRLVAVEPALAELVLVLPDSLAEALCQAPSALSASYLGSASLQLVATVTYVLLASVVGAVSSALLRRVSIL